MTRPRRFVALSVAACAALLVSSCSSQGDSVDAATKTLLQRDVQALTNAASQRDYATARTAAKTLNSDLSAARAAGKITDTKLAQIHASLLKVQSALATASAPTPQPARTTQPSSPTSPTGDGQNGDGGD